MDPQFLFILNPSGEILTNSASILSFSKSLIAVAVALPLAQSTATFNLEKSLFETVEATYST